METLPPELIVKILSYLPVKDLLNLLNETTFFKQFANCPGLLDELHLLESKYDLSWCNENLKYPKLFTKNLKINFRSKTNIASISKFITEFHQLKMLDVYVLYKGRNDPFTIHCPKTLERLYFELIESKFSNASRSIADDVQTKIFDLTNNRNSLEHLELHIRTRTKSEVLFICNHMPKLKSLNILRCKNFPFRFENFTNLEYIFRIASERK